MSLHFICETVLINFVYNILVFCTSEYINKSYNPIGRIKAGERQPRAPVPPDSHADGHVKVYF
jgi:hypothetical protein